MRLEVFIHKGSCSGFGTVSISSYFGSVLRMLGTPLLSTLITFAIVARQPSGRFMETLVSLLAGSALTEETLALGFVGTVRELRNNGFRHFNYSTF